MNLLAGVASMGPPAFWAFRHLRSAAVASWVPPSLPGHRTGTLYARAGGTGTEAVVLLHGLVSSSDIFGGAYDRLASTRRLVVPDLLGFGRSLDETRVAFTVEDHLDALDDLASETGLFQCRWTIGAHSMGAALALRWAARHRGRVDRIVCWGAPVYSSPEAACARILGTAMARLFALDTQWAERACGLSCRHRTASGWVTAACEPALPVPIARAASLHTWPAYRDAMRHLVIDTDWMDVLTTLDGSGTSVELVWGTDDKVGDRRHARDIEVVRDHVTVTLIERADHHLPLTHPVICRDQLADEVSDRPDA